MFILTVFVTTIVSISSDNAAQNGRGTDEWQWFGNGVKVNIVPFQIGLISWCFLAKREKSLEMPCSRADWPDTALKDTYCFF